MPTTRTALLVATDHYDDERFQPLHAPATDIQRFAEVLADDEVGQFDVSLLTNAPADLIRREVERRLRDANREDLVLLYWSCHGVKDEQGELYLATKDTELGLLDSTGISAAVIRRQIERSRCRRIVVVLDCCYSGAFSHGLAPRSEPRIDVRAQLGGQGRVVITASSAMEYAFEDGYFAHDYVPAEHGTGPPSVFTGVLVEGLDSGQADLDGDGLISVDELYEYVRDQVRELTPNQTPNMIAHVQGPLYIARTRRAKQPTSAWPGPPQGTAARFDGVMRHLVEIAQVHLRDGRNKAALEVISKACERVPGHAEALAIRGQVRHRLGRHLEALGDLNPALEAEPGNVVALAARGATLHALERHAEALADLNAALEAEPGNVAALAARGATLHALERHAEALGDLNPALEAEPGNVAALAARGAAHQALGCYPEALADLTLVLQRNPTHVRVLFRRADVHISRKERNEAANDVRRVLQLEPGNLAALEWLDDIHYIDRAINLSPRDPYLYVLRAMVHYRNLAHDEKRRDRSALRDLRVAIELDPTWSYPLVERGLLCYYQARLRQAGEDLKRALNLGLDDPDTVSIVARTLKSIRFKMYGSIGCSGILLLTLSKILLHIGSRLHGFWFWAATIGSILVFSFLFVIPALIHSGLDETNASASPPLERRRWITRVSGLCGGLELGEQQGLGKVRERRFMGL